MLIFSSDLFSHQPVLGILETNLSTLVLAMKETDKDFFNSLKNLTEFYIKSENTGRTVKYNNAALGSHYDSESDIMRNHNGVFILRLFKTEDKKLPKVLVWDGRV